MDHISPIWIKTEERRHKESDAQTQKDTHRDPFPQHQKCQMHISRTYIPLCSHITFLSFCQIYQLQKA